MNSSAYTALTKLFCLAMSVLIECPSTLAPFHGLSHQLWLNRLGADLALQLCGRPTLHDRGVAKNVKRQRRPSRGYVVREGFQVGIALLVEPLQVFAVGDVGAPPELASSDCRGARLFGPTLVVVNMPLTMAKASCHCKVAIT